MVELLSLPLCTIKNEDGVLEEEDDDDDDDNDFSGVVELLLFAEIRDIIVGFANFVLLNWCKVVAGSANDSLFLFNNNCGRGDTIVIMRITIIIAGTVYFDIFIPYIDSSPPSLL